MSINYVGNVQSVPAQSTSILRNKIINGGMDIDQRNEGNNTVSIYVPLSTTVSQFGADRMVWNVSKRGTGFVSNSDSLITQRLALSAVSGYASIPTDMKPFSSCVKLEFNVDNVGYGGTNIFEPTGSGNEAYMYQAVENMMFKELGWGKANAIPLVFSFWYMVNTYGYSVPAQRFNVFIKNQAGTQVYRVPVDVPAQTGSTWRKVVVSIPPPPVGSDWTGYMLVGLCFFDRTATTDTANAWDSVSTRYGLTSTYAVNTFLTGVDNATNPNAEFYLTGLQLEAGGASGFEYRPITTELSLCRRYYEKSWELGTAIGTITVANAIMYSYVSTNRPIYMYNYFTSKYRVANVVIYNPTTGATASIRNIDAGTNFQGTVNYNTQERIYVSTATGSTTLGSLLAFHFTANAEVI